MRDGPESRWRCKLHFHLPGGYTRVVSEFGSAVDIPTECIPAHLQSIGSQFVLIVTGHIPEPGDTGEEMRRALRRKPYRVEELDAAD